MCIPLEYDDIIDFYYDTDHNLFMDSNGNHVFFIYEHITPNDLLLFRAEKGYMVVRHAKIKGILCQLHWPDDE